MKKLNQQLGGLFSLVCRASLCYASIKVVKKKKNFSLKLKYICCSTERCHLSERDVTPCSFSGNLSRKDLTR